MDPVFLAVVTSAVTTLASEVSKSAAGGAGEDLWRTIKSLFGWKQDPGPKELAPQVARQLLNDQQLALKVVELLQRQNGTTTASALVGSINGDKVVVAENITHLTLN